MAQPAEAAAPPPTVSAKVEAAPAAGPNLPTAEVIGKQPMTTIYQGMYWCNVCTSGMNCEEALDMHLSGKKHKSKLNRVDGSMFLPHVKLGPLGKGPGKMKSKKAGASASTPAVVPELSFKCEICECEFNNEIPYTAHMSGKKHQKKLKAPAINSMNSRYSCALCQFVGSSPTHLDAHLAGKAHAKKAGLPAPPPGPPAVPRDPSAPKKPKPYRHNPYFKSRDRQSSSSSTGGFYKTAFVPQVKTVSEVTSTATTAHSAAYTTGIVGNYGFSLYDK